MIFFNQLFGAYIIPIKRLLDTEIHLLRRPAYRNPVSIDTGPCYLLGVIERIFDYRHNQRAR